MSAFRTARLVIDAMKPRDVPALAKALEHPEVSGTFYLGGALGPLADALDASLESMMNDRERFCGVARLLDETLIGFVQLRDDRLSYFIDYAAWGRGYAKELVAFARDTLAPARGLAQITAEVERDNERSRAVLDANAFRFVGLRDTVVVDGRGRTRTIVTLRYAYDVPP